MHIQKTNFRKYPGLIAVCIILLITACITLPVLLLSSSDSSGDADGHSSAFPTAQAPVSEPFTDEQNPETTDIPDITVNMDEIYINELTPMTDSGRKHPDPEKCVDTVWNEEDIIAYYGTGLVPPYIPEGLRQSPVNAAQKAVLSPDGEVWEDTVWLGFYHDYYEDGSPKLTEDAAATKGFYLKASKIGLLPDFSFISLMENAKASDIGGTSVYIGHQSMECGPYDADTHEPSGYYDMYVIQFTVNAIEYELVFSQTELKEAIKVTTSVIYNEKCPIVE